MPPTTERVNRAVERLRDLDLVAWLPVGVLVAGMALALVGLITHLVPRHLGVYLVWVPLCAYLLFQRWTRTIRTVAVLAIGTAVLELAFHVSEPVRSGLIGIGLGTGLVVFVWQDRFFAALPRRDRAFYSALSEIRTEAKRGRGPGSTFEAAERSNTYAIARLEGLDPPAPEWAQARDLAIRYYKIRLALLEGRIPPDEHAKPMLEAEWEEVRLAWEAAARSRARRW